LGEELRAVALTSLGIAELWSLRLDHAEPHLKQGIALARRIQLPYLEITGQAYWAIVGSYPICREP
jgi:LuxR family maltose regulon positive regulatory protein